MKVIGLQAENVKKIRAVSIVPSGSTVVVGGRNGAGKSSILDAIAYAIGGKKLACDEPVHRGESKAVIRCDLGEYVVTRTFTADGGGSLKVTNSAGVPVASPQTVLDSLFGSLSFDPLEFSRMKPKEQADTLRSLVGLDFSTLDNERVHLFEDRTIVNRDVKSLSAQHDGAIFHPGAAESETDIKSLAGDLRVAREHNEARFKAQTRVENAKRKVEDLKTQLAAAERDVEAAENEFKTTRPMPYDFLQRHGIKDDGFVDLSKIETKMGEIEKENAKVRANKAKKDLKTRLDERTADAQKLTERLEAIDRAKSEILKAAKFPIVGLSIDDHGVTFEGLPFSQASQAQKIRVSVAIGLAMNPKLRVMLIRDGSLLDDDSLSIISEIAESNDAQFWIERVGDGAECSVVIEDGEVREEKPF